MMDNCSNVHDLVAFLPDLVSQIVATNDADSVRSFGTAGDGCDFTFRKDCTDLVRRISLLAHFLEEIRDFSCSGVLTCYSSSFRSWCSDMEAALEDARCLISVAVPYKCIDIATNETSRKIFLHFQSVTMKLSNALASIPYDLFDISDEVVEQVALVRTQLQRALERYVSCNSTMDFSDHHPSLPMTKVVYQTQKANRLTRSKHIEKTIDLEVLYHSDASPGCNSEVDREIAKLCISNLHNGALNTKNIDDLKKPDVVEIPDEFLCPISLELMRDPVIVSSGQTYDRSHIQRWIDNGNTSCPKTRQRLEHLMLTTNYALRNLINQWCLENNVEHPAAVVLSGKLKNSDGSLRDVSSDMAAIQNLVQKLSSFVLDERRAAVSEIRLLSKRGTDNRILIAEAGAIPILVDLLQSEDLLTQENAVTSILNLSIYENNRNLVMLAAGAVSSIVKVLRNGSMEARENAAATIFSLSLADENKIIIGASGAISDLVELLENGSSRGKKDAATALFNLCIYKGNKGRVVRAGIVGALNKMLTDKTCPMVDEALTILSVLASNREAKMAIINGGTLPVLIDLLTTGLARDRENSAAILLSLTKRDREVLHHLMKLRAALPLNELAESGSDRAKRKAASLLGFMQNL